jgi:hypothetical protein
MASKNVETLRSVHESWNRRDFAGIVRNATEGLANIEENKLWMTRCTPCMLCGRHRKLATVYRIAVRLPRSTRRCCAIPFLGSPRVNVSPAPLFVHVVEK